MLLREEISTTNLLPLKDVIGRDYLAKEKSIQGQTTTIVMKKATLQEFNIYIYIYIYI